MRVFFGMIVGALLTVATAYAVDHWRGEATAGAADSRAMVNWSVVEDNLRVVKRHATDVWTKLSQMTAS